MILIKRDPLDSREIINVLPGKTVTEYLIEHDTNDLEPIVYVGNEQIDESDYDDRRLSDNETLLFFYSPSAVGAAIAVGIVVSLILISNIPEPEIPNAVGETRSSPNNSVSGQTNTVRKYEGIPNLYGRNISYPDLIANSIPEWVNNRKQVREIFLIGEGEYQINKIRDVKTDIDEIPESTATVYGPGTYPSELYRINFAEEVSGQELKAPDDESIQWQGNCRFATNVSRTGIACEFVASSQALVFYSPIELLTGDTFDITGSASNNATFTATNIQYQSSWPNNGGDPAYVIFVDIAVNNESAVLVNVSSTRNYFISTSTTIVSELGLSEGGSVFVSGTGDNDGEYTIDTYAVSGAQTQFYLVESITTNQGSFPDFQSAIISNQESTSEVWIGPFTMPTECEAICVNITCPRGLQNSSSGELTLSATVEIQEVDSLGADIGSPISQSSTFTGSSGTELGQTIKFNDLDGLYKIRAKRNTSKIGDSSIAYIEFNEAYTVNSYSGANFGDVTVLDVLTKTPNVASRTSSRKINADVTRKLDGVATTNFADCVVDILTRKGKVPLANIDTDELYEIADSLSDDLKEFSFTFDDKNMSVGQAVQAACNVARVKAYKEGQIWRFFREESKGRTYIFNRRNLASGENQTQTIKQRLPNEYDSVRLRYYNRDIESFDDVLILIDVDNELFTVGQAGENPYTIELAGCANYAQALNRANLEARKLVYHRWTVEDTALNDAINTQIGDRVEWCDIYDGDISDGEIISVNGSTFYTSEPITVDGVSDYYVLITNSDGLVSGPALITATNGQKSFTATISGSFEVADNFDIQAGSKYLIGKNEDLELSDFTIGERGPSSQDGLVSLKLIQYSESIFEAD